MLRRLLAGALLAWALVTPAAAFQAETITVGTLPAEARETLRLIDAGGPFPHRRDGIVFHNREGRLAHHRKGWYREYTVPTPGRRDRGARRLVTGGEPPSEYYYSDDHYRSFHRIQR